MPFDPTPLLDPRACAVVVFECQEGVIGEASALPGLAWAVRETDVVGHVATLAEGARRAGVPVVYATLRQRPGDAAPPGTTPLEHRLQREAGGGDAEALDMGPVVSGLAPAPGDVVVERHRGLTGFHGSGLDAALRETGARTIVLAGVSLNIGIPGTAIEAVNRHLFDYESALRSAPDFAQEDSQEIAVRVTRNLWNDTLHLTALGVLLGWDGGDGSVLRFDVSYDLRDALTVGAGILLYLAQEGRGIGLLNKLRAYELQEGGKDTVEANQALGFPPDLRNYGIGAQILADLGLGSIRIMTNNPKKLAGLEGFGLKITGRVPLVTAATGTNRAYLETKRDKLGHLLGRP